MLKGGAQAQDVEIPLRCARSLPATSELGDDWGMALTSFGLKEAGL